MRFISFGGGSQIGASSSYLEVNGVRLLLDVGARSGALYRRPDYNSLLALAGLERASDLDALLITHAHQDHIGGLPDFLMQAPTVPVYFHSFTGKIARIFFDYYMSYVDLPGFGTGHRLEHACDFNAARRFSEPFVINARGREVEVTLFPAGHLPGAACVRVNSDEAKLLITGDFNDQSSLFLTGVKDVPELFGERFDFLLAEATYAGRRPLAGPGVLSPDALGATVAMVLRRGGTVLIPVSPLGRAQEVLALLARDLPEEILESVPLWLDPTVLRYVSLYDELFGPELTSAWYSRMQKWTASATSSEPALSERAGIVLAPPGMLKWASPAGKMATSVLNDPRNALILVGHQLEHTPGALLESIAVTGRSPSGVSVGGQYVRLKASIYRCTLTGHASSSGLKETLRQVQASHLLLVHRHENRSEIAQFVQELAPANVLLPNEQEVVEWSPGQGVSRYRMNGGRSLEPATG